MTDYEITNFIKEKCLDWKWLTHFADSRRLPLKGPILVPSYGYDHMINCKLEDNCTAGTHGPFPCFSPLTDAYNLQQCKDAMRNKGWNITIWITADVGVAVKAYHSRTREFVEVTGYDPDESRAVCMMIVNAFKDEVMICK